MGWLQACMTEGRHAVSADSDLLPPPTQQLKSESAAVPTSTMRNLSGDVNDINNKRNNSTVDVDDDHDVVLDLDLDIDHDDSAYSTAAATSTSTPSISTPPRHSQSTPSPSPSPSPSQSSSSSSSSSISPLSKEKTTQHNHPSMTNLTTRTLMHCAMSRPPGLPPKSTDEEEKHRKEWEEIDRKFQENKLKMDKERTRQEKIRLKREDRLKQTLTQWKEVLANWEARKDRKTTRELCWTAVPPSIRGELWRKAVPNELNITEELFQILRKEAEETKEKLRVQKEKEKEVESIGKTRSVNLIPLDLPRTFSALQFFEEGQPLYHSLQDVLEAYVCYRPDIGYVQGMSFLVAILLLFVDAYHAFAILTNVLNRPCYRVFYTFDISKMGCYYSLMSRLVSSYLPNVHRNFCKIGLTSDMYIIDWFLTLFGKYLPLDVATRIWDIYLLKGDCFLFRTAVAILHMHRKTLMESEFDECITLLTTPIPQSDLLEETMFSHLEKIQLPEKKYSILLQESMRQVVGDSQ